MSGWSIVCIEGSQVIISKKYCISFSEDWFGLSKLHCEVFMSTPFKVRRQIVFPRASVCLSQIVAALNLENRLSSIHETLYKYQSAWDDMQSARMLTLPFILFELFPFELCASQKSYPLYNWKTTRAIFTKLYTNINQHEMTCRVLKW